MADFGKLAADIEAAKAQRRASESIGAASETSRRELQIERAREQFRTIGLYDYLKGEVEEMRESGYWSCFWPDDVGDRASISIGLNPKKGEERRTDHYQRDNVCHLGFQSFGMELRIYQYGPWDSLRQDEHLPLRQLDLSLGKATFERFVRAAFAEQQAADRRAEEAASR
ncbi:hypothetical protein [Paraburkholderia sp. BCC1884]|uniref:hypothetical protein n=1 Tax=Paraburkholderia sp. BCC1884 TaxID=2562668 RepID=UPI001642454C|nr:hypothetical protein [Paraburkholderia sp. BCC1884]